MPGLTVARLTLSARLCLRLSIIRCRLSGHVVCLDLWEVWCRADTMPFFSPHYKLDIHDKIFMILVMSLYLILSQLVCCFAFSWITQQSTIPFIFQPSKRVSIQFEIRQPYVW